MTIETFREALLQYSDIIEFNVYRNDLDIEIILRNKTGRNAIYDSIALNHLPDYKCLSCQLEPTYYKAWYTKIII
jgi:hypothetical protein